MKRTKRLLTVLVTVAMMATLVIPAIAAVTSSGTANTLRLEDDEETQ